MIEISLMKEKHRYTIIETQTFILRMHCHVNLTNVQQHERTLTYRTTEFKNEYSIQLMKARTMDKRRRGAMGSASDS